MKTFELSDRVDSKKVFIIQSSQLEGRLDVDFYKPEILALEYKVRSKASGKLSKYIAKIASGSTPSKTEEHKYYTTSDLGIPFLRVQNLCVNGEISFTGLKYINEETHEGLLKRSQVSGGDLLVKITGVGRMAIASVAPENFVANTNQHMVVIKPKNISSKYLAQYLNLDLVEKLASRRSTGGTRPALDYPALKSIPIIENIDFSKLNDAYIKQKRILKEAHEKLALIDAYLLEKLGITLPKEDYSFSNRVFVRNFSNIVGREWDPISISREKFKIEGGIYPNKKLFEISSIQKGQSITSSDVVSGSYPVIAGGKTSPYTHNQYNYKDETITVSASGAYSGYVWYHDYPIFASDCSVLKVKDPLVQPLYLAELLKVKQKEIYYLQKGAGQPHVYPSDLAKLKIAIPPLSIQEEIISHIQKIRDEAKQLENEANLVLENAKEEIEKMILGETE